MREAYRRFYFRPSSVWSWLKRVRSLAEFRRVLVPGGRLLVSLIHPPLEIISRVTKVGSRIAGEPLYWPTRERMRSQVEAAGLHVDSQRRIFRLVHELDSFGLHIDHLVFHPRNAGHTDRGNRSDVLHRLD